MAYKDVKKYYLQCQAQYFEMLADAKDFDEALKSGQVLQSQFDQAQQLLNVVKENYERLSYIMYLFNQPARDKKKVKYKKENSLINNYFENSPHNDEGVMLENKNVLVEFKKLIKEIKDNGK